MSNFASVFLLLLLLVGFIGLIGYSSRWLEKVAPPSNSLRGWLIRLTAAAVIVIFGFRGAFVLAIGWPPRWLEHMQHREEIGVRVSALGGWADFERECVALIQAQTNRFGGLDWRRIKPGEYTVFTYPKTDELITTGVMTNQPALPPSLTGLNPRQVSLRPEGEGNWLLEFKFYGGNATGGRGEAFYGVFVFNPEWRGERKTRYLGRKLFAVSDLAYESY